MLRHIARAILVAWTLIATSTAQDYRTEQFGNLGFEMQVYRKLTQVPMKLGNQELHLRAKFEPDKEGDFIHGKLGTYRWYLYVYEFEGKGTGKPTTGKDKDDKKPETAEEALEAAKDEFLSARRARDFEEFVKGKDDDYTQDRVFNVKGKVKKGSSKRPLSTWWEYYDKQRSLRGAEIIWYKFAAAYEINGKEVAVVCTMPIAKSGTKVPSKYRKIALSMIGSVRFAEVDTETGEDEKRDEHAKTPKQKAELDRLKENIKELENWDYFTTPRFIITYSWEKGKNEKRKVMYKFARMVSDQLEHIREKFEEEYPPHEKMETNYSVIRICADYGDFTTYSGTPGGVVGWFSPGTKELCVFYDRERMFGDEDYTLGVCFHEAWHQYSDQWWPDVELHRWFDEGLAEYFGAWRKKGSRWNFQGQKGRNMNVKSMMQAGELIPSEDIVSWPRSKFYGGNAPGHYAQAWVMVDFLKRGKKKLRGRWNDDWDKILPTYTKIALEDKDPKKAIETAFEGIDFAEYEKAWMDWHKSGRVMKK